ncbi:hypothetical protein ABK040_004452 [Willaertia magna]
MSPSRFISTSTVDNSEQLSLPVIDISPLRNTTTKNSEEFNEVIKLIGHACERFGFFYISNHGVDESLVNKLMTEGRSFFAKPLDYKNKFHMKNSRVYRGFFELGGELTYGKKDWKEGYYFSSELDENHPSVKKGLPMHGLNQWPDENDFPEFKETVLKYMDELTELGHVLMSAIGVSLGLGDSFFREKFTSEPFIPFRLFHYPSDPEAKFENGEERFGVGKHQDYGCLTILKQDHCGGLEVEDRINPGNWIKAPPIENTFVINIGDMLERWTCSRYKAAPHRVRNLSSEDRLSAPFFFDPNFECIVTPLEELALNEEDKKKFPPIKYGDYILAKVFAVFPELKENAVKF